MKNPFHDSHHACLCRRVPGNMPYLTHACNPASELSLAKAQSQISASSQCSYHNERKRQSDGCTRLADGETLAGWSAAARSLRGRIDVMFGPVSRQKLTWHSQVPESTPTIPLKCRPLSKRSPFLDPMAAGVCLGTHVQLALASQQSMVSVQHRLQLTMRHVYGHTGNLVNECADHAAAHGTFGLVSSHNLETRWVRHNFDASVCFGSCNNIGEVLDKLHNIRTETATLDQDGIQRCVNNRVLHDFHARSASHVICSEPFFPMRSPFAAPWCTSSEPLKAQLRVFLPLRVPVKVSHTTCGILWSCYFTSRFAVLSNLSSMKLTLL